MATMRFEYASVCWLNTTLYGLRIGETADRIFNDYEVDGWELVSATASPDGAFFVASVFRKRVRVSARSLPDKNQMTIGDYIRE